MSNVKAFVEGKQHLKSVEAQRQIIGNQQRVLVPSTKLNRAVPILLDHKSNTPSFQVGRSTRKRKLDGGTQPLGFDTDAESLEDTTFMDVPERRKDIPLSRWSLASSKRPSAKRPLGSQDRFDSPWAEEFSSRPENQRILPKNDIGFLSESSNGDEDSYADAPFISDSEREEFIKFKQANPLDMNFTQNAQGVISPAARTSIAASSEIPAHARHLARFSSFQSGSPTRHHAAFAVDIKNQQNDVPGIDNPPLLAKSDRIDSIGQILRTPLQAQYAVPPMSTKSTHLPFNRVGSPSLYHLGADTTSDGDAAEPSAAAQQQGGKKAGNRQAPPLPYEHGLSSPIQSEDKNTQRLAVSEPSHRSLRRSPSLDHDIDELATMTFQQLHDESFDQDFTADTSLISSELAEASLEAKLEDLCSVRDSRDQDGQHQRFFDSLSIDQHGESGELIGQKLTKLIAKMSSIRNEKRKVAIEFESEIAKREQQVEAKAAALKKEKTAMMRQTEEITTGRPV